MLRIGPLPVDPPLFLAPMAGVTDRDFRGIVRRIGGVGVVAMEFISSKNLVHGQPVHRRRAREMLAFDPEERPLSIQIYGSDAETMAEAAREVEELRPDLCDINMGCPANQVLKGCAGAALMGDLPIAARIVREVRRAVSVPLTVKFRLGLDEARMNYLELGRICQEEGADAVALHARTASQRFTGRADWRHVARLREALEIPVLGNGDVHTAEEALAMLRETGCHGVMIGRGATRDPWIFRQIADRLAAGPGTSRDPGAGPTLAERRDLVLSHFRTVASRDPEGEALHKLRKFTGWYSHGLPRGKELRRMISSLPDVATFLREVEAFFDGLEEEGIEAVRAAAA
jgi:nifR3 family TIM-barrel protein